jgi:hypothetical protein
MSCAIMSRPPLTSRRLITGNLTSAERPSPGAFCCPPLPSRSAARRGTLRMQGSIIVAPGSGSYVCAGATEQPDVLRVSGRGTTPGAASNEPDSRDLEPVSGGGRTGKVVDGAVEAAMDVGADSGVVMTTSAAGDAAAAASPRDCGCGSRMCKHRRRRTSLNSMARRPARRCSCVHGVARAGAGHANGPVCVASEANL